MDKQQKKIEEIEQFLARKILGGKAWNTRDISKGVYELITKDVVVLTREEYERLLKEETLCERLGNDIDVKLKYIYELEDKVAQVRKETVEKLAEKLKYDVSEDNELHEALNKYLKKDYFEYIDERCRELTEGK